MLLSANGRIVNAHTLGEYGIETVKSPPYAEGTEGLVLRNVRPGGSLQISFDKKKYKFQRPEGEPGDREALLGHVWREGRSFWLLRMNENGVERIPLKSR